jgi:hypothetical protein
MPSKTMTTLEFLDLLSARHDGASDYRVAKILGAKQQLTSQWRNGTVMSDNWAIKVADALKMPRAYVVACVNAERLKDAERFGDTGRVWRQIADAFRDRAAVYLLAAALGFTGFYAAPAKAGDHFQVRENVYYGKSRKYRRNRRKFRRDTIGQLRNYRRRKPGFALQTHALHRTRKSACSFATNPQ